MSSVNVSGQAYGFLAMTPVKPGEEDALRAYLESLRDAGDPLSGSPRTHMARWVIVEDFNNRPSYRQRRAEHLALPSLVFSSNFDGDLDSYLDELSTVLAVQAPQIWGRCVGGPSEAGPKLRAYLKHNQIDCGFFHAAYGEATVAKVRSSVAQRERLMAFATSSQGLEPAALQRAFVKEFGG